MGNRRSELLLLILIVLASAVLTALVWANYSYVLQNPGGSDFIPRWLGTQQYFLKGQSPYSEETTQAIQQMIYGRSAHPDEDQVLFVYPFYSIFVFGPFAVIQDFAIARTAWMVVLEITLFLIAGLSIALSRWRLSSAMLAFLLIFSLLWYHGLRPVINGNVSILCALFICLAFWGLREEHDVFAGFMLALATFKPQMVILLVIFVLLWAFSQQRSLLIWGFFGTLGLMIAATSLLIPDWLWQNLLQIVAYPGYTLPGTPRAIFTQWLPGIGRQMGIVLTVFMGGILFWEWRAAWGKDFRWFLWAAYLTLVVTTLIGVPTATENYIALYPALVLVLAIWDERWGRAGRWLLVISLLTLFAGLWWLFLATVQTFQNQPTQHSIMFFPLPVFLLIGLYWVRWVAVRPSRLPLKDVAARVDA